MGQFTTKAKPHITLQNMRSLGCRNSSCISNAPRCWHKAKINADHSHHLTATFLLIFGTSGSMKKVVDGQSRMHAAKAAVATALPAIPTDTRLGLMVFGHRRANCSDIQFVAPFGSEDARAIVMHANDMEA